jgi:glutamate---cysteine ligase / carboxylate-amine ligase
MARTIGVEEELLLVDADDAGPRAIAGRLLPADDGIEAELQEQQLEICTPPTTDLGTLRTALVDWRQRADQLARSEGARIAATGTCPLPIQPQLMLKPRYRAMAEHLGLTSAEQLTCGCHVHIAVDSPDEGVGVLDRIRVWLPVLVALSANSPFWQGRDSGYASFRTQAWHRFPTAGPTPPLGTGAAYDAHVAALLATGVPLDEGMIYFDARLSRHYPTVEVRVADVCLRVGDAVLIAALVRALVSTAAREWATGRSALGGSAELIRLAAWRASRFGLTGQLIDPFRWAQRPAWEVVEALVDHVAPALAETGDDGLVSSQLELLRREGTGADVQRRLVAQGNDLADLVRALVEQTLEAS